MRSCVVSVRRVRRAVAAAALALACASCDRPAQQTASEQPTAVPPQAAAATAVTRDALPRSVAGITLGMTRAAAEGKLGHLTCHAGKAGCEVCDPDKEQGSDIHHLQLYLHHDQVISVSYEGAAPANVWDTLNQLIDRAPELLLRRAGRTEQRRRDPSPNRDPIRKGFADILDLAVRHGIRTD